MDLTSTVTHDLVTCQLPDPHVIYRMKTKHESVGSLNTNYIAHKSVVQIKQLLSAVFKQIEVISGDRIKDNSGFIHEAKHTAK